MATKTDKLDLYKQHRDEYKAKTTPAIITVGPAQYIACEGSGAPGGDAFTRALANLYAAAYTLKFQSKAAGRDYVVCKLEGLYWIDDDRQIMDVPPGELQWKLLIRVPDFIGAKELKAAQQEVMRKDKAPSIEDVKLETLREGTCAQIMHIGPYENEQPTIDAMLVFAREQGYKPAGLHHEIYLNDPRRTAPEKLKTIIRQPVKER